MQGGRCFEGDDFMEFYFFIKLRVEVFLINFSMVDSCMLVTSIICNALWCRRYNVEYKSAYLLLLGLCWGAGVRMFLMSSGFFSVLNALWWAGNFLLCWLKGKRTNFLTYAIGWLRFNNKNVVKKQHQTTAERAYYQQPITGTNTVTFYFKIFHKTSFKVRKK